MEITEVRVKLMEEPGERLQAFCSITFDDSFVVRDLKIIEGSTGPFVAMPSRKLTAHCFQCGSKNHLRASFCNQCGTRLKEHQAVKDGEGRAKLYADIAHPINSALPGNDPGSRHPGIRRGARAGQVARLCLELRRHRRRGDGCGSSGVGCPLRAVGVDAGPAPGAAPRSAQAPKPPVASREAHRRRIRGGDLRLSEA